MEGTFIPETPEKNNRRTIAVVIGAVLAVLVGVGAFLYYQQKPKDSPLVLESPQNAVANDKDLLRILAQGSGLVFPELISSVPASQEVLPESVKGFIFPSAEEIKAERSVFSDNTVGFSLSYKINMAFTDAYRAFVTQRFSGWDKVYGARNDRLGLIDFEMQTFKARVIVGISGANTNITVVSISK